MEVPAIQCSEDSTGSKVAETPTSKSRGLPPRWAVHHLAARLLVDPVRFQLCGVVWCYWS